MTNLQGIEMSLYISLLLVSKYYHSASPRYEYFKERSNSYNSSLTLPGTTGSKSRNILWAFQLFLHLCWSCWSCRCCCLCSTTDWYWPDPGWCCGWWLAVCRTDCVSWPLSLSVCRPLRVPRPPPATPVWSNIIQTLHPTPLQYNTILLTTILPELQYSKTLIL